MYVVSCGVVGGGVVHVGPGAVVVAVLLKQLLLLLLLISHTTI